MKESERERERERERETTERQIDAENLRPDPTKRSGDCCLAWFAFSRWLLVRFSIYSRFTLDLLLTDS